MFRPSFYLCVMFLVSSCGGGGGESSSVEKSNHAPVITNPGALSIREGISNVVALIGTDADGNSLTFEIVSGDDQSLFVITPAGNLSFVTAPDFEAPSDADRDNKYLVDVEVTDGTLTDSESLVIVVINAFEGRVVDGPISGALVFIDLNGNNQLDADEPTGTTNPDGYFQVDSFSLPTVGVAKVVSMGGLDTKTGKALPDLALVSDVPTDKTQPVNVTPLTTVISAATTPEEKAQVLSAFGISGSVEELLTSDGWARAEAGDENAQANQRLNQQVGLLLQTATTLTDDADESTDVSVALAQSVAKQISVVAQSEGSIDLTASTTIKTVLTDAAQEITPSIDDATSAVKAVADALAMVNTIVADITLDPLSDMATEIVETAQDSLQASISDVFSESITIDAFTEEAGTVKLFENISVAADAIDSDSDGIPNVLDSDDDNDGVADALDAFPLDATETIDTDGDDIGNNADSDDDNDGVADDADAFPLDLTESIDTDGDDIGNNADSDDDNDGVADDADSFPLDLTESIDTDGDDIGNNSDSDDDNDGVADALDAFPLDATETIDTDGDDIGNNADSDDDNDGVADALDAFPLDATETIDTDGDDIGNNADSDDDNDGVADALDAFPLDATETIDTDGDDIGNNADSDDDNDGVADALDAFPLDATETIDTDGDDIGNNADSDDDNDGVADALDAFPLDATETIDTDGDDIGNNADSDDDNDGVADALDAFPLDATETIDTDGDDIGNNADSDDDNDGVADALDAFPLDATETIDTDGDDIGNNADSDDDNDGVADALDAFPLDATETIDTDGDDIGNNADSDDDNDGVADALDAFPLDATETIDTDGDDIGNNADSDDDNDGVADALDAFPLDATETIDTDGDDIGNNADSDDDNDGVADALDAFPLDATETIDTDGDDIGNNADSDDDNDGVADALDAFPLDATETIDTDGDDIGNNADSDDDNDGVADALDAFPLDATETIDTDGDDIGNNADSDDDNDGVADALDAFPLDATETIDTDGDDIGNNADSDDDNDGVADALDAFPLDATETIDTDGDDIGNNADSDDDNDGVADALDAFPLDATETIDTDGDDIGNNADSDDDNDGVADALDAFPLDATETIDTDGDDIGNNADSDDDNDGVADALDAFPLDATETIDTDGDDIGNNADSDDDNDGVADALDAFPLDATETIDTDGDDIGNNADSDDDNDGVADALDAFPLDATETIDTDGDDIGNNADSDDDNDGVADALDAFPLDATETIDTDGDDIGNNADSDDDNDGVADDADAFPLDLTENIDTDGDDIGNNSDSDDDNDGVADALDAFPLDATETIDTDGDDIGNNADSDDDNDGVADGSDPEPLDITKTPPLAIIDTDISTGDAPLRVVFNSNSSIAGNPEDITDSIISTTWNSGDETAGSGSTFEHIYYSEGDYTVSLTVTNSDGYSHVETYPIKVTSNNSLISISGSISIPSTYVVDSDVNDQDTTPQSNDLFSSAQEISRSSVVSGYVNQPLFGELGNSWLFGDINDVYRVNALGGEVINLIVGNKNLGDLDIRIRNLDGTYIDFSVGDSTLYESITLPDVSDTYFIVVDAFSGASNYLLEIGGSKSLAMHGWNNEVEIADNELLVKENKNYSMTSIRQTQKTMGVQKVDTIHATDYSGPVLYKLDTSTFLSSSIKSGQSPRSASWMPFSSPKYETLLKAKELKALNHFEYVEPNFIRKRSALPNDPLYPFQSWHYEQINLPEAWNRSTGMGNVKVAVIDTGVALDHPDLVHRVTNDGYDFVSSVFSSGDGDGVDSDASDPGDGRDNPLCPLSANQSSSFHGTHVAGTVGATGNDGAGVTGVNWNVDIMPIRVLGCYGGDNYDMAQAIYYAAGLPNAYGLSPNSPADIINLSLGSLYSSYFESTAIQSAIDSGVIVIAAAGNEAMDGNPISYPASYPGVISVGAVNPDGKRAWYSNFNYDVDIVAPGGYSASNPFSTPSGHIYSTFANITNGSILPSFEATMGTSMAAPHVAGVISLMKGIYPSLTPKDLDDALSLGLMTVDIGTLGQDSEYGFGLIDANKALQTAEGLVSGVNTDFPPLLNLTTYEIDLGVTATEFTVQAYNAGGGLISITDVVASSQNISISAPDSDDGLGEYTVSLDRNNLSQGVYMGSIQFSSDSGSRTLIIYFEELASNAEQPDGGKIYSLLYDLISDDPIKQVSSLAVSGQYSFTIEDINPDVYFLVTGSDLDNDGFICGPAEACAYWPSKEQEDLIVANKSFDNIDMALRFEAQVSASSQAFSTVNSSKALKIESNCEKEIDVTRSDKVRIYPCVKQHLRDLK